jgi:CheY-like chemotaxis protein
MTEGMIQHTVLVVEDEEDLREMMREALELNGYAVVTAQDGHHALAQLPRIQHLCLVLIDLLMPGMNGWDLFDELRRRPELDRVPVVVYSSDVWRVALDSSRILRGLNRLVR